MKRHDENPPMVILPIGDGKWSDAREAFAAVLHHHRDNLASQQLLDLFFRLGECARLFADCRMLAVGDGDGSFRLRTVATPDRCDTHPGRWWYARRRRSHIRS